MPPCACHVGMNRVSPDKPARHTGITRASLADVCCVVGGDGANGFTEERSNGGERRPLIASGKSCGRSIGRRAQRADSRDTRGGRYKPPGVGSGLYLPTLASRQAACGGQSTGPPFVSVPLFLLLHRYLRSL